MPAGVLLAVVGVFLLIGAVIVAQGVASFNSTCSQNPLCQPETDPSGAIAGIGVALLVLGIVLVVYDRIRAAD